MQGQEKKTDFPEWLHIDLEKAQRPQIRCEVIQRQITDFICHALLTHKQKAFHKIFQITNIMDLIRDYYLYDWPASLASDDILQDSGIDAPIHPPVKCIQNKLQRYLLNPYVGDYTAWLWEKGQNETKDLDHDLEFISFIWGSDDNDPCRRALKKHIIFLLFDYPLHDYSAQAHLAFDALFCLLENCLNQIVHLSCPWGLIETNFFTCAGSSTSGSFDETYMNQSESNILEGKVAISTLGGPPLHHFLKTKFTSVKLRLEKKRFLITCVRDFLDEKKKECSQYKVSWKQMIADW